MQISAGYADVNGAKIYYEETGQGYPLVFIHAGVADRRMWDEQVAFFADHYRIIRFDLRGFGKTSPVPGSFSYRDDLSGLLACLGVERACLIGCSMGGMTAMDLTLEHPEAVEALVMVGSAPWGLDLDVPAPTKFAEAEAAEERQDWERLIELSAQIWYDGEGRGPQDVDPVKREFVKQMQRDALPYRSMPQGQPIPMKPSAAERLDELHVPLLIICGTHDTPYIVAASEYMRQHVAHAKKVMLDSAHLPGMDRPAQFNRILRDFLAEHIKQG
jgi:pimeloyl-ACP methyl ester carboxylesterase